MTGIKIDLDRDILYEVTPDRRPRGGVVIRRDPATSADVFMYKQDPGVYYSANAMEVSATMAARAGFDVERYRKDREKMLKMRDFQEKWDRDNSTAEKKVVASRGEYKLIFVYGLGYYVEDSEGKSMTPNARANTEQEGLDWLTDFAGPEVKADGNVPGNSGPGGSGADRSAGPNGTGSPVVRKAGDPKAAIPA